MAYAYCRVSNKSQMRGLSLTMQREKIKNTAHKLGWSIKYYIKVVGSAFKSDPYEFKNSNITNTTMMFYSIDRFSRNKHLAKQIVALLLYRNNVLYFVKENLLIDSVHGKNYVTFLKCICAAENESRLIGSRIRDVKQYKKLKGMYVGGRVPFGSKIELNKNTNQQYLVNNEEEQHIINFIKACKTKGTSANKLNNLLAKCGVNVKRHRLILDTGTNGEYSECELSTDLSNKTITHLLNEYQLGNKHWTPSFIVHIIKKN